MDIFSLVNQYPAPSRLNSQTVFASLGTFWTQIFQEKGTIKGLTQADTEEAIQQYYALVEAVSAYAVKDCPVFALEKWKPLVIKKSEYSRVPFVFEQHGAVFGVQPDSDVFYGGVTFQFGKGKSPKSDVYSFYPTDKFLDLSILANRILTPSATFTNGIEFIYRDSTLFFNFDLFNDGRFTQRELVGDNGEPVTFVDNDGVVQQDYILTAWLYCANVDKDYLYDNYGRIFDVKQDSSEAYKTLLKNLVWLHTDGPSVKSIKSALLALLGEIPIQESQEVVEDIFDADGKHIVVTNYNVYKIPETKTLNPDVFLGATLFAGDSISTTVEYYDNNQSPSWWKTKLTPSFSAGNNLLFGQYKSVLTFSNSVQLLTVDWNGNIHFPVTGLPEDVATFHAGLNQAAIKTAMGLSNGSVYPLNPVSFLFENFCKSNTSLLLFNLTSDTEFQAFSFFDYVKDYLPPHVYFLAKFSVALTNDTYNRFVKCVPITFDSGTQLLSADASNDSGTIQNLSPYNYKDIKNRRFSVGIGNQGPVPAEACIANVNVHFGPGPTILSQLEGSSDLLIFQDGSPVQYDISNDSEILISGDGSALLLQTGGFLLQDPFDADVHGLFVQALSQTTNYPSDLTTEQIQLIELLN